MLVQQFSSDGSACSLAMKLRFLYLCGTKRAGDQGEQGPIVSSRREGSMHTLGDGLHDVQCSEVVLSVQEVWRQRGDRSVGKDPVPRGPQCSVKLSPAQSSVWAVGTRWQTRMQVSAGGLVAAVHALAEAPHSTARQAL